MPFVEKNDWEDTPSTSTPITAAELLRIEAGIEEGVVPATETQSGNVQLATAQEMSTGVDLSRVPSVKRVKDYVTSAIATVNTPIIVLGAADPVPAGTKNGTIVLRRYT